MPINGVDPVYLVRPARPALDEVGQGEATRLATALAAFGPMVMIRSALQRVLATAPQIGAGAHLRMVIRQTKPPRPENLSVFTTWDREVDAVVVNGPHKDKTSAHHAGAHITGLTASQHFSERRLHLSGWND